MNADGRSRVEPCVYDQTITYLLAGALLGTLFVTFAARLSEERRNLLAISLRPARLTLISTGRTRRR